MCQVAEWPVDAADIATDSLRFLALNRTHFPTSVAQRLQNVQELSDFTGGFGWAQATWNNKKKTILHPQVASLRLKFNMLWQEDLSPFLPNLTSLQICHCSALEDIWCPLFEQLELLHASAAHGQLTTRGQSA